ncbi:aromatic prenyltransferase [Hypoxylon trugodes]|uniref:aromatic prenyltransferase n=1 Tax=Hypoxylon trugodes TaxID=326681 RepID=UPI00219EB498|nr:aromatic prenyltransferase [Hypoxylon trugodes]KAI1389671.1 aromatic prenyltransferase [Hypoxylon trugodes]
MATVSIDSPVSPVSPMARRRPFDAWPINRPSTAEGPMYWFQTSGQDLSNMLREADCPQDIQRQFLTWYRDTICPQLGSKPEADSLKSVSGWDGNPFEYSFELKGTTKNPGVRFAVDFAPLRPADKVNPLSLAPAQRVLDSLAKKGTMFDDNWHRALARWFTHAHRSTEEQQALISKVGYQSSMMIGFDVASKILIPGKLPVMAKDYFAPDMTAATMGINNWEVVSQGIRQLPSIEQYPNILSSVKMMEGYLAEHPGLENGTRGMSTDCVAPGLARLKIYMRYHGESFEEIWDYYTLGGRIPNLESDKETFRDLWNYTNGTFFDSEVDENGEKYEVKPGLLRHKPVAIYFSLSPKKPYPIPKIYFSPARKAPNDKVIARGLDAWLMKYGWYDGGKTMEERVTSVFTHRKLEEKVGIFTFVGLGRKESSDPSKAGLSLQVYLTPELYETPRV